MKRVIARSPLRTNKGSEVMRMFGNVGKAIGGHVYLHKNYATDVMSPDRWKRAQEICKEVDPDLFNSYNCIRYTFNNGNVRFDECPDFDTAREPHVGRYLEVSPKTGEVVRSGHSNSIFHHKWLWVKDDYKGFNVQESYDWSKLWLSKLQETAKGTDRTWKAQLNQYGLQ